MSARFLVVCLNPTLQKTFRLPALNPGQVNRARSHHLYVAGKGVNVTRVLVQLGEDVIHLTQAGGAALETYLDLCRADGVPLHVVDAPVEIRTCYTLIDDRERRATEIVEEGSPVGPQVEEAVAKAYDELLPSAHTVIISGSKAPGFTDDLYPWMVRRAREAGVRVCLDVRGSDLERSMPHRPALIKINVSEFAHTFGSVLPEDLPDHEVPDAIPERMVEVRRESGAEVVLTNGSGSVLYTGALGVERARPERVEVVNTVGSGDSVMAGIAAGLRRGAPIAEAVGLGVECGTKNVRFEKPGTIR